MAKKNQVTPRGELVKFARELGLESMEQNALLRLIDEAQTTDDPKQHLQQFADQLRGITEIHVAASDESVAAAERVAEVLDGAATDTVVATMESPPCKTFAPVKVDDPEFFLRLPNLSAVECNGHLTRHVDLQLNKYPLARKTLTLLRHHLDKSNARLSTNRHATNPAAALVWLLEQYGRAAGLKE